MFKIFEKLGGETATLEVLERRRGRLLSSHSVRLWKFNRQIPPVNAVELMDECRSLGIPVSMDDFRLPKELPSRSKDGQANSSPRAGHGRGQGRARP